MNKGDNMKLIKDLGIRDLSGALAPSGNPRRARYGLYECESCGSRHERKVSLQKRSTTGLCKSCSSRKTGTTVNRKHGLATHRLNSILHGMEIRCYSESHKQYHDYGGKGVFICDEWRGNVTNFYNWAMSNGYKDGLTIDRIDSNGGYEPSNCQWITHSENNNKTHLKIKGDKEKLLTELRLKGLSTKRIAERLGVSDCTVRRHFKRLGI